MIRFALRRFGWACWVVWVVATAVFALMYAIGDPATATLGPRAQRAQIEAFRRQHGLDRPIWQQYLSYLGIGGCVRPQSPRFAAGDSCGFLQGDLGDSLAYNEPVATVVVRRLPRTLLLGALSMVIEVGLGLLLGLVAVWRRYTWLDTTLMLLGFLGISVPAFVLGIWFLDVLAFRWGWFPVGGYGVDAWDHLRHALLPALTLAVLGAAVYARVFRGELLETLQAPFVRTAMAKGAGKARVMLVHVARHALLPIVTLMGLQLPVLVSGAIITETLFAWPGMGSLAMEAVYNLDAPVVLGVVWVSSIMVQVGNFVADVAVAALDPRVRSGPQA